MDVESAFFGFKFKLHELAVGSASLLILIQVLREDIGAPGVSLTPLLVLTVEKLESEYAFSELAHNIGPQHGLNLFIVVRVKAKQ